MPEITEADRAAARAFNREHGGCCDNALSQAFASHREATEAAIVAWLRGGEFTVYGRPVTVATLREIANQIEAGAHKC